MIEVVLNIDYCFERDCGKINEILISFVYLGKRNYLE